MHLSELHTLFLTNRGILQKKETFYKVTAIRVRKYYIRIRVVNIGN